MLGLSTVRLMGDASTFLEDYANHQNREQEQALYFWAQDVVHPVVQGTSQAASSTVQRTSQLANALQIEMVLIYSIRI